MLKLYSKNSLKKKSFKLYTIISIYTITISITLASIGSFLENKVLLTLHPYIFFIGFGNLSILILNKYLLATIFDEIKVNNEDNFLYIKLITLTLILITFSVIFNIPILKSIASLILIGI